MDKKIIFGLVGPMASGKDAVKKYLEEKYQGTSFRFSSILRGVLDCLGIEHKRDNMIALSTWVRHTFGEDLLAKAIAKNVEESENNLIIVDGIRRLTDIEYLKRNPNFVLVAIDAKAKIRYERAVKRNENVGDDEKTYEDFLTDHTKETEATIPEVMLQANFNINNDEGFQELYQQVEQIIKAIQAK